MRNPNRTDEDREAQRAFNVMMSGAITASEELASRRARRMWAIEETWLDRLLVRLRIRKPRAVPWVRVVDDDAIALVRHH